MVECFHKKIQSWSICDLDLPELGALCSMWIYCSPILEVMGNSLLRFKLDKTGLRLCVFAQVHVLAPSHSSARFLKKQKI